MRRKERIEYKYREDGSIRAYDSLKGTNISERQIWSEQAIITTLTSSTPPRDCKTELLNSTREGFCPAITASYHKCRGVYNATKHGYPFVIEIYEKKKTGYTP